VPFRNERVKVTQDSSLGKSCARAEIYIEHWKMKVSSLAESEPSKVSGVRGLMDVGLGVAVIPPILCANNASERARLGASSGSSSGSGSGSGSSSGSGCSFGLSGGGD
jgi:hypothetical protein